MKPDRRVVLKSLGVSVALPLLESMRPGNAQAANMPPPPAKRLICIGTYLGYYTPEFFPANTGSDYQTPSLLASLDAMRGDFSLLSGLDHRAPNGHKYWRNFLTGTGAAAVSLDQIVAQEIGVQTRFASLQLTCGSPPAEGQMCFTKEGVHLPMIGRPSVLFEKLFTSEAGKARTRYLLESNQSVLDLVTEEATSLSKKLSVRDRAKLNEYLASLRDVEKEVQKQRDWIDRPAAKVDYDLPRFDPVSPDLSLECETIMYDLMSLAIETDSTRVLSFLVPGSGQVFTIKGEQLSAGYHGLSHHGNDPEKIAEFMKINRAHIERFAAFLGRLKEKTDEAGRPLLETSLILFGGGMGDANLHDNSHLPVLVAGGGLRHGSHHAFRRDDSSPRLLGDLFITLMQQLGLKRDRFAAAKHNISEVLL